MKDYWLVVSYLDKMIEICFPDNEMNNINACLATISEQEMYRILEILLGIDENTNPFRLGYEYFTMEISYYIIDCEFHMFDEPIQFYLYTRVFKEALAEYLVKLDELKKIRD